MLYFATAEVGISRFFNPVYVTLEFLFLRKLLLSAAPRKLSRIEVGSISPIPPLVVSKSKL